MCTLCACVRARVCTVSSAAYFPVLVDAFVVACWSFSPFQSSARRIHSCQRRAHSQKQSSTRILKTLSSMSPVACAFWHRYFMHVTCTHSLVRACACVCACVPVCLCVYVCVCGGLTGTLQSTRTIAASSLSQRLTSQGTQPAGVLAYQTCNVRKHRHRRTRNTREHRHRRTTH